MIRYQRRRREWVADVEVGAQEARFIADLIPRSDGAYKEWDDLALELDARNNPDEDEEDRLP